MVGLIDKLGGKLKPEKQQSSEMPLFTSLFSPGYFLFARL